MNAVLAFIFAIFGGVIALLALALGEMHLYGTAIFISAVITSSLCFLARGTVAK